MKYKMGIDFEVSLTSLPKPIQENGGIELDTIPKGGTQSETCGDPAVAIRNAEKSYGSAQPVLKGLNMTVPCGSIYGLLGQSGCGKTTLLSCIVGLAKLNQGGIWIFGGRPGDKSIGIPGRNIGYMPQEISLYNEFSILETLAYFGTLCGMTAENIEKTGSFLSNLLQLPKDSTRVGSLSGGQQRRVSLLVALLSQPDLLILDEPTVGIDPLIRQRIWQHLKTLARENRTTVIITTHYIDECRTADHIGIMRNGRLLEERPTQELMLAHGTTNLEKIVLELCRQEAASSSHYIQHQSHITPVKSAPPRMASVSRKPTTGARDALGRIKALAEKNFVILYRNLMLLFMFVLVAPLQVIVICISFSHDPRQLTLGLVNEELIADENFTCATATLHQSEAECTLEMLSCHYLSHISEDVLNLVTYETEMEAIDAIHKGNSWGYILFPSNFSAAFIQRISFGVYAADELSFNSSFFLIRLDETNMQISNTIKVTLMDAFSDFVRSMLRGCGYDPRIGEVSLQYRPSVFGDEGSSISQFIPPAAALAILLFYPIVTTSLRYIREKKSGVLHRSLVGGVKTWEILAAYMISEFVVLLLQTLLTFAAITLIFQAHVKGSHVLVMVLYLLAGYGGVSLGFLLGTMCSEEIQAAILAIAIFLPNLILGSVFWPLEGIHGVFNYVVQALPCTLAVESVRSIISRGWGFTHPNVWPGFAVLIIHIVGYFILVVLVRTIIGRH